jgi:serine/threonine protein kinase
MENYVVLGRVGEGAHGIVMKARHRFTGEVVALKKVALKSHNQQQQRPEEGGAGGGEGWLINEPTIREIKALQELNSIHVIR